MLVVAGRTTEFGSFYKFEPLTLCPIDKTPICLEMMSSDEKTWLNTYHKKVYQQLAPLLTTEEQIWLGKATSEI
jgi:Xaa-Pro aminopeptidase